MKGYIEVELGSLFKAPGDPDDKLEDYEYCLSVLNATGIPVLFQEYRKFKTLEEIIGETEK